MLVRDAITCAGAVITAWWKELQRPSGDLKDLDTLGIDLATSLAAIDLAPPPVDSFVKVVREPMDALNQLDGAAGDFILPLSPLFSQQCWLAQPSPTALSPFDSPTSYSS